MTRLVSNEAVIKDRVTNVFSCTSVEYKFQKTSNIQCNEFQIPQSIIIFD